MANLVGFVAAGVLNTLGAQVISYHGGGSAESGLLLLPNYIGMALVGLTKKGDARVPSQKPFLVIASFDFMAAMLFTYGLSLAGSSLATVVGSSTMLFTAVLSFILLHRSQTKGQWMALCLVTFGLAINMISQEEELVEDLEDSEPGDDDTAKVMLGLVYTMASSVFYAAEFVYCDYSLSGATATPIQPEVVAQWSGTYSTILTLMYIAFCTVPSWNEMVSAPLRKNGGDGPTVLKIYAVQAATSFAANYFYFNLVQSSGAVAAGLASAPRTVLIFVLSAMLFCGHQESQCFNSIKAWSAFFVVGGVLAYGYFQPRAAAKKHEDLLPN